MTETPIALPEMTEPPMPFGEYMVDYDIEYPDEDCFMLMNMTIMDGNTTKYELDYAVPESLYTTIILQDSITLGIDYTVQDVMEAAVDNDPDLFFSVLYTGSDTGYFVRAVSGLKSNADCMWFLYYRAPNMLYPFLKSYGVSHFPAEPNSTVVMRYQYPPIHEVHYELYFPHVNCSEFLPRPEPLDIKLYFGAPNYTYTVQEVMELAVDIDPSYEFIVTYYGKRRGYEIDAINGTENNSLCTWHFFYLPARVPRMEAILSGNISYTTVEANSTIIMSFQVEDKPEPSTDPPTEEPTPESTSVAPSSSSPSPSPTEITLPPEETEETSSIPMPSASPTNNGVKTAATRLLVLLTLITLFVYL
jgi:hypothetical protein